MEAKAIMLDIRDNVATCTSDVPKGASVRCLGGTEAEVQAAQGIPESGDMLLKKFTEVCNGRLTKAEAYVFSDIAVDHVCRFVY